MGYSILTDAKIYALYKNDLLANNLKKELPSLDFRELYFKCLIPITALDSMETLKNLFAYIINKTIPDIDFTNIFIDITTKNY